MVAVAVAVATVVCLLMPFIRLLARDDIFGGVNEIDHKDVLLVSTAAVPAAAVDDDNDDNDDDDEAVDLPVDEPFVAAVCAFNDCDGANCVVFVIDFNGLAGSK